MKTPDQQMPAPPLTGRVGLDLLKASSSKVPGVSLVDFLNTTEGKEAMKKKKIVLAGPPRSGKSCLRQGLKDVIRQTSDVYPYILTACPDGEGAWFQEAMNSNPELAAKLKAEYKTKFTPEFVKRITDAVRNLSLPLSFIDIGGMTTKENAEICSGANGAIILCGETAVKTDAPAEWKKFFTELGIPVIAEVYSDYHGKEDIVEGVGDDGIFRGSVHHLERGQNLSDRETIRALTEFVLHLGEESSLRKQKRKYMTYGSERFESATANNHNEVLLTDTHKVTKIVLGKDVALVLPKNPDEIPKWASYPTHQESWLPLWFVLLNHSQHQTPEELAYRHKLNEQLTPEDRQLMRKALVFKANEFWQAYKEDVGTKEPRKKYKNITRIIQDILLYIDAPETVIENQDKYLVSHRLYPMIQKANKLRQGVDLEQAGDLETQVEQILSGYTQEFGKEESEVAYKELQGKLLQASSSELVVLVPDKNIIDADFYANLVSYDLLMSEDEHDQDVVSIVPSLEEPKFYQLDTKFGPRLAQGRRMDVIAVPENLGTWDVVRGGKDSYQPISMILMTHTKPETEKGARMQERLQKELKPQFVAHHYLGAAEEFLNRDAWGKSFAKRYEGAGVKQIKKVIPLYRVVCDLLPRAVYMLKTGKFTSGVENSELWEVGEVKDEAEKIQEFLKRQDATQEELIELARAIEIKLRKWSTDEDYLLFLENMKQMGQLETLTESKIFPKSFN